MEVLEVHDLFGTLPPRERWELVELGLGVLEAPFISLELGGELFKGDLCRIRSTRDRDTAENVAIPCLRVILLSVQRVGEIEVEVFSHYFTIFSNCFIVSWSISSRDS